MRRVVLLLVDGLRPDLAESMLEAGELPHLAAMTRTGGRARGITAFPSTTTVAYLPFLTGASPGQCNIPSIRWLDRKTYAGRWWRDRERIRSYCGYQSGRVDTDLPEQIPTIFELVPESLGIFTPIARGLDARRDPARTARKFWGALAHYALWHQPSDDAVSKHLLREIEEPWRFIFAQFPAVDGYTHQTTPDAAPVRRALRGFDETVGRLRARLAIRDELEETLILMVSDHGAASVHTHLDLADWFRAQGVRTLSHPIIWERAPHAAVMVAGNASAMIYADPDRPSAHRRPIEALRRGEPFGTHRDLVTALAAEAAVACVVGEMEGGGLRIISSEGEATLHQDMEWLDYRPESGDPLGVGPQRLTAREWLEASWDSAYPDAAWQLMDQFQAPRTGDLLVIARDGYDFRKRYEMPEHKAGHGSLIRTHMQVPVWTSHPVAPGPLRTTELFPIMLDWLGVDAPKSIEDKTASVALSSRAERGI
jgi:hypothetical protein